MKQLVTLSPTEMDLGEISKESIREITFDIINDSSESVKIVSNAQSCGCTDLIYPIKEIKAKSKAQMKLEFNPEKENKKFSKSVFLRLDNAQILIFKFKGSVKQDSN